MKIFTNNFILLLSCLLLYSGHSIQAFSYNYSYSATRKYSRDPLTGPYEGVIIVNPNFNHSLNGWNVLAHGVVDERISDESKSFVVVRSRKQPLDSFSQKGNIYYASLSYGVQLSGGNGTVDVEGEMKHGAVIAQHGYRSMPKSGIAANFSGPILFELVMKKVWWHGRLTFFALSVKYVLIFEEGSVSFNLKVSLFIYHEGL